jgi:hypothetical protein
MKHSFVVISIKKIVIVVLETTVYVISKIRRSENVPN